MTGTLVGRRNRPHLLEAWGQRFNLQLEDHVALFRYSDVPGVIGRVGTLLGDRGINIGQMAVGVVPGGGDDGADRRGRDGPHDRRARCPASCSPTSSALDGFADGRAVTLGLGPVVAIFALAHMSCAGAWAWGEVPRAAARGRARGRRARTSRCSAG